MNGELFFVNPTPVAEAENCDAAGVAYSDDLACVAYVSRGLQKVEFFVNENEKSFRKCPYWPNWKRNCTMFKQGEFNFSRVLLDSGRKAALVGFDAKEIKVTGDKYIPVDVNLWAPSILAFIQDIFLREIFEHAAKDPTSVAAMVKYFWDSLRIMDGKKVLTSPSDPGEPIKAIVLALASERIDRDRVNAEFNRLQTDERDAKKKQAEERERERLQKRNALLKEMRKYEREHGYVRVRILSNHFVRQLQYTAAMSLIDMRAAEFYP